MHNTPEVMADFDDKPLPPAGEISDTSDNDTEARISTSPQEANRTLLFNDDNASARVDPPPSQNTTAGSNNLSLDQSTQNEKNVKDDSKNDITRVSDAHNGNHASADAKSPHDATLASPPLPSDINTSAVTDVSVVSNSVDPDGVCPKHRHFESLVFTDKMLDENVPRDSIGAAPRSPSPLSNDGNILEQNEGPIENFQTIPTLKEKKDSLVDETSPLIRQQTEYISEQPAPSHLENEDPPLNGTGNAPGQADSNMKASETIVMAGEQQAVPNMEEKKENFSETPSPIHLEYRYSNVSQASRPLEQVQDTVRSNSGTAPLNNRQMNGSPFVDGDASLPSMIRYQQTGRIMDNVAAASLPPLPPIVVPNVQRRTVGPSHMNNYQSHPYQAIPSMDQYQGMPSMDHNHQYQGHPSMGGPSQMIVGGGKRKIHLRLIEDIRPPKGKKVSFLTPFRRNRKKLNALMSTPGSQLGEKKVEEYLDRGRVTVSWYDGTTSIELFEHVRNCVIRKLGMPGTVKLSDLRILDEAFDPPEEIVLSPYIPNGSRLLLRFSTADKGGDVTPEGTYNGGAPESPSAAPSPYSSNVDLNGLGLNPNQLALLGARLKGLESTESSSRAIKMERKKVHREKRGKVGSPERKASKDIDINEQDENDNESSATFEMQSLHPEDHIEKSLRQITELLIADRTKRYVPRQEKRQVVFVLANYFVLFLSLIAISAEIQARVPDWHTSIEQQLKNVQNCSKDEDSLYECVSKGDLAGLIASVVLWISRSAATRRIFLFGFESPQKLWTVVYESMVTAFCWGCSYMFIRRGMNPDTNRNFLQKYWKDAVYGSLAGFNAAFMKHVMKNLIPQEAIEDALMQDRKLKILSWLKY